MDDNVLRRLLSQLMPEDLDTVPNALAQAMQSQSPVSLGQDFPDQNSRRAEQLARNNPQAVEIDPYAQPGGPMRMNSMRIESGPNAGKVTSLNFQPPQQQAQAPQGMRTVGYGDGNVVDLGVDKSPPAPIDFSRGMADIPGVGKGYYTKDGRSAVVTNPDGTKTKVILGYDMAGSMALNKANLEREQGQAQIAHINEEIAASQQARNTKEGIPGMGIPQTVLEKQFGKAPDGQRWTERGVLEDVPGGNGGKLNESQAKAAGMGSRALEAHKILLDYEGKGVTTPGLIKQAADGVPLIGTALGMGVNKLPEKLGGPSTAQQGVEQAQRDFVNAVLRPESGASISASEFDNARKQYFPQPGDDPATIRQKQQAREREIHALEIMSGPGSRQMNQPQKSGIERGRAIFDAKKAVAEGRNRQVLSQRLQAMGIDPREAGL